MVSKSPATATTLAQTRYISADRESRQRVVLIHGFTQNGASFREIASTLASNFPFEVICVDLPGHGGSSGIKADLGQTANLLSPLGMESIWVGYSLGARNLLTLCLLNPDHTWKVILSGVNPGIEDETERYQRYQDDLALAAKIRLLKDDPAGFKEFLKSWMALPLFQPRITRSSDIETRLANSPDGLANSLESTSVGVQPNLWPEIVKLRGKLTLITGGSDSKYLRIAERAKASLENCKGLEISCEVIDGLGHAAIFDHPQTLIDAVASRVDI
ncbi:MAG: alpha/beta fold hydrolase [Actinomycetota bacterium]|nr:alpha/beta fold hydrolase [Actinomycetota bacterium]